MLSPPVQFAHALQPRRSSLPLRDWEEKQSAVVLGFFSEGGNDLTFVQDEKLMSVPGVSSAPGVILSLAFAGVVESVTDTEFTITATEGVCAATLSLVDCVLNYEDGREIPAEMHEVSKEFLGGRVVEISLQGILRNGLLWHLYQVHD